MYPPVNLGGHDQGREVRSTGRSTLFCDHEKVYTLYTKKAEAAALNRFRPQQVQGLGSLVFWTLGFRVHEAWGIWFKGPGIRAFSLTVSVVRPDRK